MAKTTKTRLRRIGNSLGVIIPKEVLEKLGVREGEELTLSEGSQPGSLQLSAQDTTFQRKLDALRRIVEHHGAAFRELAK